MALIRADRVEETTGTQGLADFVLAGAVTGSQGFADALADSDTCYYCCVAVNAAGDAISTNTYNALVYATSWFDGNSTPAKLIDGAGTGGTEGWTAASGAPQTVGIIFPGPKAVATLKWTSRPAEGNRSPKNFTVDMSSDYASYTTVKTVTNETGWGSSEERTFTL